MTNTRECLWEFLRFSMLFEKAEIFAELGLSEDEYDIEIDEDVLAFVRKYGPLDGLPDKCVLEGQTYERDPIHVYANLAYGYKGILDVALALADSKPASCPQWQAATYCRDKITDDKWRAMQFDVAYQRKVFAALASSVVYTQNIGTTITWVRDRMELHFDYGCSEIDEEGEPIPPVGNVSDLLCVQMAAVLTSPETILTCSICGNLFQAEHLRGRKRGRVFCSEDCKEEGNRIKNKAAQRKKRAKGV